MGQNPLISPELQTIEREYVRDVRIVEARPFLKRLGYIASIVLEVLLAVFFIIVVIGYIISGSFTDLRSAGVAFGSNTANFRAIASASDAKELSLGSAKVIQGTSSSFDFFATIKNPNDDWYATFTYTFSGNNVTVPAQDGFVMPGEDTYLLALGVDADNRPGSVSVSVENIVWHRVNRHIAPDSKEWLSDHNGFLISTPTYTTDIDFSEKTIGRTTFSITNVTPYAYWSPQFVVILERAGAVVGISRATLTELEAGEIREVDVRWYENLPVTATTRVESMINFFDDGVYMPPRGTPEVDIRDSVE